MAGDPAPTYTVTYSGFVGTDDPSVLGGTLNIVDDTAGDYTTLGVFSITPSGLTSTNYAITFVPGTLTIVATPPTVSPSNSNQDIQIRNGNSTAAHTITSNGLVPLSYGTYKRGEAVVLDFLVRNPGAKVLELGELSLPSFFSVEGDALPESLGSFESALLQVRVDTSTAGTLEGQVSLASNDPDANESPFVFNVTLRVSDDPANVVNVVAGIPLGEVSVTPGQGEVALLSFYLSVPEGSVDVDLNSLNLGSTNLAGISQATSLKLYIDGGTRGERDQGDILLATLSQEDIQSLSFSFPTRTLQPNLPLWLLVVGEF